MITQDELKRLLHYNPETGVFTWLITRNNNVKAGAPAGGINTDGYLKIKLHGKTYSAHRLCWLYMTGVWPPEQVDHINNFRSDNRWVNLRLATDEQNRFNRKNMPNSISKYKGVCWDKDLNKWRSRIFYKGKSINLGRFSCEIEAARAYNEASKKYHGEFAYLNPV